MGQVREGKAGLHCIRQTIRPSNLAIFIRILSRDSDERDSRTLSQGTNPEADFKPTMSQLRSR